jgi:hypothetical protein
VSRAPFGLCALLAAFAYQLLCILQPMEFLHRHVLLMDDTFYYLQVARNLALTGVSTFDGIHPTSGINLLWGLALTALAKVVPADRDVLIRACLILSAVLALLTGLVLRSWLRSLRSALAGEWAGLLYGTFLMALVPHVLGMEYPLHTLVVILALRAWERALRLPAEATPAQLLGLGLLLTLNFWVRIDSALFMAAAVASVGYRLAQVHPRRIAALAALVTAPILGGPGFVLTSMLLGDTPTPVSGLVKQHYASLHFADWPWYVALAGHGVWWLRVHARAVLDTVCSALTEPLPWSHPALLATMAVVFPVVLWRLRALWRSRSSDPRLAGLLRFVGIVAVTAAVHSAAVTWLVGQWSHVLQHYYSWLLLLWFLVMALLLEQAFAAWPEAARSRAVGAALLVTAVLWGSIAWRHFGSADPDDMHLRRARVVDWIHRHIPEGAILGSWNAGQLGYTCQRTVVNLDGLVNDRAFYQRLRRREPILDYLRQEGIRYVVDNEGRDIIMPYRKTWDRTQRFRDEIPWSAAELLFREEGQENPLVVLRIR